MNGNKPTYDDVRVAMEHLNYDDLKLLQRRVDAVMKQREGLSRRINHRPTIYELEKTFSEIMQNRYYVRYGMTKDDFLLALEEAYNLGRKK